MKSKNFFFNVALFRDFLVRHWNIVTIYLVILTAGSFGVKGLNQITLELLSVDSAADLITSTMTYYFRFAWSFACFFVMLFSANLMEFLYQRRAAEFYGALPMRRETIFWSAAAALLVPLLVANVIILGVNCVIYAAWLGEVISTLLQLFLMLCLSNVVFWGIALLCCVVCGTRGWAVLLMIFTNFFGVFLRTVLQNVSSPFKYGVSASFDALKLLSPVVSLTEKQYFGSWLLLGIYAVLGAVLAWVASRLFRLRKPEKTGEGLVFGPARFAVSAIAATLLGLGLGSGIVGALLSRSDERTASMFGAIPGDISHLALMLVCVLVAGLIWFVLIEARLARSLKILLKRGPGALTVTVLCAFCVLFGVYDLDGRVHQVPQAADVESVTASLMVEKTLTDPADIEAVIAAHKDIIERYDSGEIADMLAELGYSEQSSAGREIIIVSRYVVFNYRMSDGSELSRSYVVPVWKYEDGSYVDDALARVDAALGFQDSNEDLSVSATLADLGTYLSDPTAVIVTAEWYGQDEEGSRIEGGVTFAIGNDTASILDAVVQDVRESGLRAHAGSDPLAAEAGGSMSLESLLTGDTFTFDLSWDCTPATLAWLEENIP